MWGGGYKWVPPPLGCTFYTLFSVLFGFEHSRFSVVQADTRVQHAGVQAHMVVPEPSGPSSGGTIMWVCVCVGGGVQVGTPSAGL